MPFRAVCRSQQRARPLLPRTGRIGRAAAIALGQFPAYPSRGHADSIGGRAGVGNRREQRIPPEVVSLPPGNHIGQVRLGFPRTAAAAGQRTAAYASRGHETSTPEGTTPVSRRGHQVDQAGPTPAERAGAQVKEDLAREGIAAKMQRRQLARKVNDAGIPGQPAEQDPAGVDRVLRSGTPPGRHIQTQAMILDTASQAGRLLGRPGRRRPGQSAGTRIAASPWVAGSSGRARVPAEAPTSRRG